MSIFGLAASRRCFVLVTPDNVLVARSTRTPAGLAALFERASRAPPLRLVVEERLFREVSSGDRVLAAHDLCIVPSGLVEGIHAVAAQRHRSARATAAILARIPSADWFACDLRRRMPGSDRQIQLF